jgi:Asp-tRNA(Asn)/Glu-tRNA(Gln) amidotransferase A subunit family amidase
MNELLTMSVKEMAERIRAGKLSPVELLETHIKRVREVNPYINAVIAERFSEARRKPRPRNLRWQKAGTTCRLCSACRARSRTPTR